MVFVFFEKNTKNKPHNTHTHTHTHRYTASVCTAVNAYYLRDKDKYGPAAGAGTEGNTSGGGREGPTASPGGGTTALAGEGDDDDETVGAASGGDVWGMGQYGPPPRAPPRQVTAHPSAVTALSAGALCDPKWGGRYVHAKGRLYIIIHAIDGERYVHELI